MSRQREHTRAGLAEANPAGESSPPPGRKEVPRGPAGWSVGRKLALGSGLIALFIGLIAAVGFGATSTIVANFNRVINDSLVEQRALGDIDTNSRLFLAAVREHILGGDGSRGGQIEATTAALEEALAAYAATEVAYHTDERRAEGNFAGELQVAVAALQNRADALVALHEAGAAEAELAAAIDQLAAAEGELETLLAGAEAALEQEVQQTTQAVRRGLIRARAFLILFSVSGLVLTGGVTFLLHRSIVSRLRSLAVTAGQVAGGNLNQLARVDGGDEISGLAVAFNTMTTRLRDSIFNLEELVEDRTRQLETTLKLSQRLTGILDLSDLLREVVVMTKENFGYHNTRIYLLDGDTLVMAEGSGPAGDEMKRRGHSILLDAPKSLAARAARQSRTIIIQNVRDDSTWLPDPLSPQTYSEIAVPIKSGHEVLGVLDVQSDQINSWTPQDKATLEALAGQVAVAVRNAQIFSQTREALYQAQRLQQLYVRDAWQKFTNEITTIYEAHQPPASPIQNVSTPEAIAALQQKQTIDLRLPPVETGTNGQKEAGSAEVRRALATPLKLRNQIIGVLGIQDDDSERQWTGDEIALIEAVSEQMSLAIENARLFEETSRTADREKIIADVTQQVWASGELEKVMQTAVEQLGVTLEASRVILRLGTKEQLAQQPHSGSSAPER